MAEVETKKPVPNMNKEYNIVLTPLSNGRIQVYDISRYLVPYNGRDRDNRLAQTTHEIHGKTASIYIIDDHNLLTRKQAIAVARRFIDGDFDTYRLD